ncbi:winged helix-turn-helix domain-containing protein [Marinicella sp. S1101]|uniref:winged helix-turn-helix domain-containing protein n=1 Tax=Marinicella marina TaxID=2996016 RepID=UPI002260E76C|nr:winged helix-turn-helix domain-containing protein [Marinicella marina]MCX7553212.1 winged helix-turn-helix domain-containing protein [Marinicella marina]MDJ1138944.1 winged helix-turn-helix domain-containing protein [Marinicella marina]
MTRTMPTYMQSAGFLLETETGQVAALAESEEHLSVANEGRRVRLSPVNRRVLLALWSAAGQVVSRQQLFDQVWPNQTISDDALSRSISDLRSQLKTMSGEHPLIETVPKVGYRWVPPVTEHPPKSTNHALPNCHKKQQPLASQTTHKLAALVLALLMVVVLSLMVLGWMQYQTRAAAQSTNLIILKTTPDDSADWSACLKQATQVQPNMHYLSEHARSAHPGNPYPFFAHEFNIRWFITSHVSQQAGQQVVSFSLIDARTGLVIREQRHPVAETIDPSLCRDWVQAIDNHKSP